MFLEWESNSGKIQIISEKFPNNTINDVKQISLSRVNCNVKKQVFFKENLNSYCNWLMW